MSSFSPLNKQNIKMKKIASQNDKLLLKELEIKIS